MKLRLLASLVALLAVVATIENVEAQPYPSRPIKLVVSYAPGGAGDVIARIISERSPVRAVRDGRAQEVRRFPERACDPRRVRVQR